MKICIAQTEAIIGDVRQNIFKHMQMAEAAALHGSTLIIFPELSITGYEPEVAAGLAANANDGNFNKLQELSNEKNIMIGAGMPITTDQGVSIAMIIFHPNQQRQTYFKQYLHPDEEPYFVAGPYQKVLDTAKEKIALAICYEISVPKHSEQAHRIGADIYIASVAKTVSGVEKAIETLSETAKKYSMTVLLSNCIGKCEGKEAGGRSSVWNSDGSLLAQLSDKSEGIIIFDTNTREINITHEFAGEKRPQVGLNK